MPNFALHIWGWQPYCAQILWASGEEMVPLGLILAMGIDLISLVRLPCIGKTQG